MRTLRAAAAGLVLAAAFAPSAHAQTFPTLRVGQPVSGTLSATDPAMHGRGRFKVYQFSAEAGRRYVARMESEAMDSYITVARTVGGVTDHMFTDDDGSGEGTNSRLRFAVPASGTYMIIAQSLVEDGQGAFTLQLDTVAYRAPTVGAINVGQTVTGELSETDAEFEGGNEGEGWYDLYRFQGTAGQRLRVRAEMGEYFPTLEVGTMNGQQFVPLETISTGMSSSSANVTLPAAGEYFVRAGAYGSVTSPYTLTLEERAPTPEPRAQPIAAGATVSGSLAAGDPELEDGRWYEAYAYTGRAGERIRVSLRSEDFDAFLIVGRVVNGEFQEIQSNDDAEGGEGLNSLIEMELPEAGRYVIQATSLSPESEGAFELTVGTP